MLEDIIEKYLIYESTRHKDYEKFTENKDYIKLRNRILRTVFGMGIMLVLSVIIIICDLRNRKAPNPNYLYMMMIVFYPLLFFWIFKITKLENKLILENDTKYIVYCFFDRYKHTRTKNEYKELINGIMIKCKSLTGKDELERITSSTWAISGFIVGILGIESFIVLKSLLGILLFISSCIWLIYKVVKYLSLFDKLNTNYIYRVKRLTVNLEYEYYGYYNYTKRSTKVHWPKRRGIYNDID